jgi:hypothetical protein
VLAGLTITGGTVGISCGDASPTIRNCTIGSNGPNAIEFLEGYEPPKIIDCTILGEVVEVYEPALVAYWALDETEGDIAYDSAGELDGTLNGEPLWQPGAGIVAGALEFDGIDDYVSIPSFLSTGSSRLSIFAWIKGGAPGQVIISQTGVFGGTWLSTNSSEGKLVTGLDDVFFGALESESVITDGQWHHVGLVWGSFNRILYVDHVEVASDTCDKGRLFGVLQIGAGINLDPGTFWSGLIDDVRIYNRVVIP